MDPITHGLLGASCAKALLRKSKQSVIWQAGALAAMAPDLDILIQISSQPLSGEIWHRSFTHSLIFIPIGAMIVSFFLILFSHFRNYWKLTFIASLIGYSTHCLLDACTSYGTLLFWPWSWSRISWDVVSIVDPMVTVPLLAGLIWTIYYKNQVGVITGLLTVTLFFIANSVQHQRALHQVNQFALDNNIALKSDDFRAIPLLASSTNWQVVGKTKKNCIFIARASVPYWGTPSINFPQQFPHFTANQSTIGQSPNQQQAVNVFSWFSDDYAIIANSSPLIIADGRYMQSINPAIALWGIKVNSPASIEKVRNITLSQPCN